MMRPALTLTATLTLTSAPITHAAETTPAASVHYVATFTQPPHANAPKETFKVRLTSPEDIADAQKMLKGEIGKKVPVGRILHGITDVNTGYSWSLDPTTFAFGDDSLEVCDGRPSWIEDGRFTYPYFCPWSATLTTLTPLPA